MKTKGTGVITGWSVIVPVWFYKQWIIYCGFLKKLHLLNTYCVPSLCWFWGCFCKVGGRSRPFIFSQREYSSVQSLSCVWHFKTWWTAALQASLSIINSQSLLKLMSIESVMPSNHLILCRPLLLLPSVFPSKGLFQWVSSWHQVAKVLEFQLQHQSFQWVFRTDFL